MFDYIGLDRQILAAIPPGDVQTSFATLDWGIVVPPTADGIAEGSSALWTPPAPGRQADPDGRFDRVAIAPRLADLLDVLVARGGAPSTRPISKSHISQR